MPWSISSRLEGLHALQSYIPFVVTFVLQGLFEEMDGNAPA